MIVRKYVLCRRLFDKLIAFNLKKRNFAQNANASCAAVINPIVPEINMPSRLIHEHIWCNIDKWPERTALVCGETGRSYTFRELHCKSESLAYFLRRNLKHEAQDTVAIVLPNVPEYLIAVLGSLTGGLKVTPINPLYTQEEIVKQIASSGAKSVITLNESYEMVRKCTASMKKVNIPIITVNRQQNQSTPRGAINFHEICDKSTPDNSHFPSDHGDVAILPYSSGTTGKPKGVELTHSSVVSNLHQIMDENFLLNAETTNSHQDVIPVVLPLFHIYALIVVVFNALHLGSKSVTLSKFTTANFINVLEQHPPHLLYLVPPIILMLLNNQNVKLSHFKSVRAIMSSAAPLGAADIERFHEKTSGKIDLMQMYGCTEASPLILCQSKTLKNGVKIGGSGLLLPNTLAKIVDVDDTSMTNLGPNKSGELLMKGPQIMKGYHMNAESTKSTIIDDGWLRTGDIAHYDDDGQFYVTDRLKELIKVKGFQVAPAELEEILRDHPNVVDAAVIGIGHEQFGEVPKAYVVAKPSAIKAEQLEEYVASKVAPYKRLLGGVTFIDAIPKTKTGKILRRNLKALNAK